MTAFAESHGRLADKAYHPYDERLDTSAFLLIKEVNQHSGYRGFIYQDIASKNYVVVHTGTEFDVDKFRDLMVTDAQMALLKINQQLDDARATVELAMAMAKRDGTRVTVAGHSLGGFHTQVTCAEYGCTNDTFSINGKHDELVNVM